MSSGAYTTRIVDPVLDELLDNAPAVLITGPRACGKTTTAGRRAQTIVRLDVPAEAAQFHSDPDAALRRLEPPVLIDEWQNVPAVLPAIKRLTDEGSEPGGFILTGSIRFHHAPELWPGTGRIARLRMFGLTEAELAGGPDLDVLIPRLVDGELQGPRSPEDLPGYLSRAVRGGMPTPALGERTGARWYGDYLEQFVDSDLASAGATVDGGRLMAYLMALAENTAGAPSDATLYTAAGVTAKTARRYDELLAGLGIVDLAPAWTTNRIKRLSSRRKVYMTDTGLTAAALQADVDDILADGHLFGRMIDSFVAAQLRPVLAATRRRTLHHVRSSDGRHEVDLLIDLGHRGVVAIEIKAAAAVTAKDARHLTWLRDSLGSRFARGIVLHTGPTTFELGDRIVAAPISALWA
ncbi:ATP-binding protein [Ruania rhizosphaerae]|uniref:ATP-binding protein n=1 Tax=Ruania rhizosphaerae TaxID=1840413 RepID=UPI001358AC46|nr:DUF4143 domain-containing protein [Ruania rhizosphaerae]